MSVAFSADRPMCACAGWCRLKPISCYFGCCLAACLQKTIAIARCHADEAEEAITCAEDMGLVRRSRHSSQEGLLEKVQSALNKDAYALKPAPPQLQDCVPHLEPVIKEGDAPRSYKLHVETQAGW